MHHGVGLFLAAGSLLIVVTGLALQHPDWLGRGALPPSVVAANPGDARHLLRASPALVEESRDGGLAWHDLPLPAAPDRPLALVFAPGDEGSVWLLGLTELLVSRDGGGVWERLDLPPGLSHDESPLALTITADERPLVASAYGAWLGDEQAAAWSVLWRVEPTRGDRLRDWARRLHSGHWGLPATAAAYDIGALLFVTVLATGVALGARRRKHDRKHS